MKLVSADWLTSFRNRSVLAGLTAVSLVLGVLPVTATHVDGTSTEEFDIWTIPSPLVIFEYEDPGTGEQVETVIDAPYFGSTIKGDHVALTDSLNQGEGLLWSGIGYPQPIGDDFPVGWTSMNVDDMNSAGTMVGSYLTGEQGSVEVHGYVWSISGGFVDIEPPQSVSVSQPIVAIQVTGIAETGWITGTFFADPGVCSEVINNCAFVGSPNGPGYDFTILSQPFTPSDIEYVGDAEHVVVGDQGMVWTESGGLTQLDVGGAAGLVARALDVNESGQIVGDILEPSAPSFDGAFWETPSAPLTIIDPLQGHDDSQAVSINNNGTVVGVSRTSLQTTSSAFSWEPGDTAAQDLGHLTGLTGYSSANSISDNGQVLGQSDGRAVIWDLTGSYEINYPPSISPIGLSTTVVEGDILQYFPPVNDAEESELEVDWTDLPPGAEVDEMGTVTWRTNLGDAGTYTPTFVVSEVATPASSATAVVTFEVQPFDGQGSSVFSSTGFRVHSMPVSPYPGAPSWSPEHINDSGWVVFGSLLSDANSWWDGTGYPNTDIGCGNCDSFTIEDINNSNSMAGSFVTPSGSTRGYVWTETAGFTDIGEPTNFAAGAKIEVFGIDDQGRVAGIFSSTEWCPDDYRGGTSPVLGTECMFIATPEDDEYSFEVLPSLTPAPGDNSEVIFGVVDTEGGRVLGPNWRWDANNGYVLLNTTGGEAALAFDINQSGEIAGWLESSDELGAVPAYWDTPATIPEQALLVGHSNGAASGINGDGWIVGYSETTRVSFNPEAILFKPGDDRPVDLGRVGISPSFAVDINNNGLVVGIAQGTAFIWDLDDDFSINYPPEVINPDNFRGEANAGQELFYAPTIRDPEGDPFDVTYTDLPSDAEPSGSSGVRWQTSVGDEGFYVATMTVAQNGEDLFSVPVTLVVYGPAGELPVEYTGLVWDDFDGDGLFGPLELPRHGTLIYLDLNNNSSWDPEEEPFTTSDVDGTFAIRTDVSEGVVLRQEALSGYNQSSPPGWRLDPLNGSRVGLDFSNQPIADGDLDGDGIENSIDATSDPLAYEYRTFSVAFDDSVIGGGSTSGEIVDSGPLTLTVGDHPFPLLGVLLKASGPPGETAELELCDFTSSVEGGTTAAVTCGSLQLEVVTGKVTTFTSDGAEVDIGAGSSAIIDDDGASATVEVVAGVATIRTTTGETVVVLAGETVDLNDLDGDGVESVSDLCLGTELPDDVFEEKKNRYSANEEGDFVDPYGRLANVTVEDTHGCSGEQIVAQIGGKSHQQLGPTLSLLWDWIVINS